MINATLHADLSLPYYVNDFFYRNYVRFKEKLPINPKQHIVDLDSPDIRNFDSRRLKRQWSEDILRRD